jgi:HAD superfamily hydrolase (TIGR01459 family)
MTKTITGINTILDQYDLYIFDLWGVVHDGHAPFSDTMKTFDFLKQHDKTVAILSNAPRRVDNTILRLKEMGIEKGVHYDVVLTSGQDCYEHLCQRPTPFYQKLGEKYYHPGPERDQSSYTYIPYTKVENLEEADFWLLSSVLGESMDDSIDLYADRMALCLEKNISIVCANADKRVLYGEKEVMCVGKVAQDFQDMGGNVVMHGKPNIGVFQKIYDIAVAKVGKDIPKSRCLMIGDSLGTDIMGANNFGIDSLLVKTGIHGKELNQTNNDLTQLVLEYKAVPTYFDLCVRV